ncbi:ABC transporter permease [Shinella sp.]|uniref:ABC transporter permease n=1 Tax=Shinella sp. TaxID=1870904 RepID=UPI003F6EA446
MTEISADIPPIRLERPALSALSRTGLQQLGKSRLGVLLAALVLPVSLLLIWSVTASLGWIPVQILPPPSMVVDAFFELTATGELQAHTLISLERVLWGFALGAVIGLPLGAVMGISETARKYLDPIFLAIAQVPPIGWIPMLILFLGIGEGLKIVIIAKAAMIPMAVNTYAGIRNVPIAWREVGEVMTFNKSMQLRYIVLPASLPTIFSGIRYGLANAWLALVAVELLASSEGLGYLMVWGRQLFAMEFVLLAMVFVGLIGFALDASLAAVEARLLKWQRVAA